MNTHLTVKQLPESERPYEKAFEKGSKVCPMPNFWR